MTQQAFPKLLSSQIAFDIARTILDGFDKHYRLFRQASQQARRYFETADWATAQQAARYAAPAFRASGHIPRRTSGVKSGGVASDAVEDAASGPARALLLPARHARRSEWVEGTTPATVNHARHAHAVN